MYTVVVLLILLGIILLLVETFLTPGVGVAGILGIASLISSCVYTFARAGQAAGLAVTAIVTIIVVILVVWALRSKTWKKFSLNTVIDSKVNDEPEKLSAGMKGKTETRLAPMGKARFSDISCEVKSEDNSMIDAETPVEIVRIEDRKVIVKPITEE